MQEEKSAYAQELERLLAKEKDARFNNDYNEALRVAKAIVVLCVDSQHYEGLVEVTETLCKRRGQHKKVQIELVQGCFAQLGRFSGEARTRVIERIRDVCDKKIFLEVEYARCVLLLVREKEDSDLGEAAKILQEVQVQTYGSMDKREKIEFILYQMRIMLRRQDYVRFFIISKKITEKNLDAPLFDLKMQYHAYLAAYFNHSRLHHEAALAYRAILDIQLARKDLQANTTLDFGFDAALPSVFANYVAFTCLEQYSTSQIEELNSAKTKYRELFGANEACLQLTNAFLSTELSPSELSSYRLGMPVFAALPGHEGHLSLLRQRLIEHNIRVCSLYYERVGLRRMSELVGCTAEECEKFVCRLMNEKILHCSIDRIDRVVDFHQQEHENHRLEQWSSRVNEVLDLVDEASSLIQLEIDGSK